MTLYKVSVRIEERALALAWWRGLNTEHQETMIKLLRMQKNSKGDGILQSEILRAYRQCPNVHYKDKEKS